MSDIAAYVAEEPQCRDHLVTEYAPLVKRIAFHLASRLPASIQPDDLIQAGMIGLLDASRNYSASHGASFETYAGIRIRGSMIDEIRRNDWAPRSVHRKMRAMSEAVQRVESAKGVSARESEIAEEMGIPLDEYYQMVRDISGHRILSFEDVGLNENIVGSGIADDSMNPEASLQAQDLKDIVTNAISSLPQREQLVLSLYYDEELNLREIGDVLGVSESRVCQIHGQALIRLQTRVGTRPERKKGKKS